MKCANLKCVAFGALTMLASAWVCGAGELYHMVRVTSPTAEVTGKMAALGLPMDDSRKAGTELEIPLSEADVGLLEGAGIDYRIVQKDLEAHYGQVCQDNLAAVKALGGGVALVGEVALGTGGPTNMTYGSMGGFYNYNEILASLDKMRQLYPNLCAARVSVGKTGEGRDIWMVKITKNPDANESKPECLVDGVHHAREPGTYTAMLYAMWHLLENYGKDAEATYLVDHRNLCFVPVVNVDGFVYNVQNSPNGGGMWRKNRRNNGAGNYGVDLNRNYPYQWGYDNSGSSPMASSDTYRGPSGGSEPEVQVMMNFVNTHSIRTAMSFHSYAGLCMYPYGYTNVQTEHADVFAEYAKVMTAENGYACGPTYSTIYPVNGATPDWQLHEKDILAFTPEIGTSSFWPAQDLIFKEAKENLRTQLHLFWGAGGKTEVKSVKVADGLLNAGQTEQLAVAIQNKGWSASEPVTVQVTCTDAYVTVSGGTWSAGSLDRRAAATNLFTATVAADCPKGHPVRFTVTVTQGDWVKSEERVVIVGSQGLCDPSEAYQYVLITSRAIRDATTTPNVRDLIAHRQAKGMTATIVAIEDILGAEYYKGVDDPETLRNFIRDAYNTWKTDFVLLGGDTTIIPMRKLYCSQVKDGNVFGWEHLPSDLYFQCLDGNYNLSNDSAWGEPTDGGGGQDIDLMAEVYLGRASVENATEMANFVYKTLLYETQSAGESYLRNHLLAGQFLGSGFGETNTIFVYGASYMTVAGHSTNAGGYATLSFDSCPLFNATTMYQYDDDLAGRPRWSGGDMIAKMNSGQFSIINHMGHGQYWSALNIDNGSVGGLSNPKPFFVFAEDCYSGGFDQDCIAERLISDNRSGAYAVVMNSRYGFGSYNTNWVNFDGPTLRIHRYFWNSYFGKNKVCLGAMIADGHEDSIWLLNREMARWCIYDTVFFGDPATPMRGRAEEATIAYDSATTDDTEGNGDGVINPGELVKLWVTLSNVGIKRTTGVEATLTCTDSYVTVTDNYAVYGEMPGMESKKQASYVIAISPSCPTPYEVTFNLNISDTTGGVWAASFKKTVYTSRRISGIVTEALGGTPLAGATVEYTGPRSGMVQTDAGGRYSILMTDGKATLVAKYQQPYFDSDPVTVTVPPDASGVNFAMGYADIDVAPTSIVVTASMGETPTLNLTIRNVGARNLTWSILDEGGAVISTNAPRQTAGNVTRELTNDARAAIAFDGNVLWENHPPYLYKLDPMTGALLGKLNVCAATPSARQLTWDGDNLWIKGPRNYSPKCYDVYAVNPETGNPVKTLRIYPSAEVGGVAAGEGFLWMMESTTPRKMLKVDSATGLVKGSWTIPAAVDANPKGIAYCNGAIWVVANGKVFKLNPADGSVISSFQGPANYIEYLAKNGPNQMWMVSFNNKKTLLVDLGETLWLKEDLTSGTVAGGGSQTITLTLDTVAAKVGTYEAEIHVRSNDPSKKELLVPVKFTVTASGTTNQPPTASAQSVSTAEDTPLVITLTGSDPEGSALTCTVVSSPAHGTLTGTGASRTYTPVANYNGSDSFTFKVNDGALDSAPATVSIAVTTGAVAPDAPTGLTATTVATNQINLAWADNATNEVGYVVNRSLDSTNWTFVTLTAVNATNYSNTGLTTNTLYYYRVAASNAGGLSAYCFASARTWSVYEAWRQRQFGGTSLTNSAISGATADPDRDGLNNEQEFWAGTSPTNAASCLALYSLTNNPAAPSEYLVRWQSVSDRWYTVQAATNLLTGFNLNLRTNIPGTPPVNVHTDSVSGVGSRFYRVKVE